MWLECIGVISVCFCKEVYIYIDFLIILLIPTPLVLALFCTASLLLCSFLKCFLFLFMLFLCNIL